MNSCDCVLDVEALLACEGRVRALAARLVSASDVDEIVQQTLVAAFRCPPRAGLASWLESVVRRRVARLRRSRVRRAAREKASARAEALPSTVELLQRTEARSRVVEAVRGLAEPYRSVVLLHYFEGLELREIARRRGLPDATVRTQLRRAIRELRWRLGVESDDRQGALAPLLTLGHEEARVAIGVGFLAMSVPKLLGGVAALLAVLVALVSLLFDGGGDGLTEPDLGPEAAILGQRAANESNATSRTDADSAEPRLTTARPFATLSGRVVDPAGLPIAQVPLHVPINALDEIGGSAVATTDSLGRFSIVRPRGDRAMRLLVGEPYVTLRTTDVRPGRDDELLIVAAPAVELSGRCSDAASGDPIAGVLLSVSGFEIRGCPLPLDATVTPRLPFTRTNAVGEFAMRLPATRAVSFALSKVGYASRLEVCPVSASYGVVFELVRESRRPVLDGFVLNADGAPISDAHVACGSHRFRTDAQGHFSFEVAGVPCELVAVASGFAPVVRSVDRVPEQPIRITLRPASAIAGRAIGPSGKPVSGLKVQVCDATPLGLTIAEAPVEPRRYASQDAWDVMATTNENGHFTLTGLADREYRVRLFRPDTLVAQVVEGVRAGTRDLIVRWVGSGASRPLVGRVLSADDRPVAGARLRIRLNTSTRRNSEFFRYGPERRSSAIGRFRFRSVPRQNVEICVDGDAILERVVKVEELLAGGSSKEFVLRVLRVCHVQILPALVALHGARAWFEDRGGRRVEWALRGSGGRTREVLLGAAASPTYAVPENVRTLVIARGDGRTERRPVTVVPGEVTRIRP